MSDFFVTYRSHLIYTVAVFCAVLLLRLATRWGYRLACKRLGRQLPHDELHSLEILRLVLNALWLVLGLIAIAFSFAEEKDYAGLVANFKLVLYLGVVTVATIVGAALINKWFRRNIARKLRHGNDPTNLKFFRYVGIVGVYVLGMCFGVLAFPSLRGIATTLLSGAGVLALIAGVASQEALSNLVGGIFIITFKPFKIGDVIEISGPLIGRVEEITLRHTVIKNFENKMIVVPNSIINKEKLVNYDLGDRRCCERIEIGISYDSDVKLAKEILRQECEQHPLCLDHRTPNQIREHAPKVRTALTKYNDSSVTIRAWVWAATIDDAYDLRWDVLEAVKARYEREGIELPFPYRTVVFKGEGGKKHSADEPI